MQICAFCGNDQNRDTATFCARCGRVLPGIMPSMGTGQLPPQTIIHRRYVIVRRVGQGGMGAVYQVTDLHIQGKIWALKEMSDAALSDPAERARAITAFQLEAQLLATLKHPNLPQVIDYFTEGGRHYLVMDFIAGETLEETLARSGPLPEGQVLAWAAQLCDVLSYLHHQPKPIIFRDLKPGNVMITPHGQIKLIDFGIARFFKPGQQSDTLPFGTEGYSPPEQYGRGQTDARSDIYSLGVTLHELLTGYDPTQTPFQLPPARQLNSALSPQVEQAILQATAMNPHHRFASVAEMRTALTAPSVAPGVAPAPGPLPAPPPVVQPAAPSSAQTPVPVVGRRPASAVVMVVVILSLVSAIGAWAILNPDPPTPTPRPTTRSATTTAGAATAMYTATGPTATLVLLVSDTPSPTPTHTDTPSPTPSRTATRTPSPTPTQTDVEAAIIAVIWRYVDLKARAMGYWETDELNTALRRDALSTQRGSVNWLRENNSHWEYDLHSMTFDRFEHLSDTHVRVLVTKVETGRYYHQGSPTPSEKKSYYNYQYEIWYEMEKIGERWYIVDIDLYTDRILVL